MPSSPFPGQPYAHGHLPRHHRGPPRNNDRMKPSRIITQTNTQPRTKSSEQWSMTTTTKETMHTNNTFTRLRRNRRTTKKPHPARQVPIGLPRHTKKSMHITTATVEPHRPEKGTSKRLPRPSQTLRYDGHTITATGNKPYRAPRKHPPQTGKTRRTWTL